LQKTTKEFDGWLECAQLIILTLEETVKRDEIPVESIADMDVLIQKFAPNIVLLKDRRWKSKRREHAVNY